jgi:hypothetical protein
MLLGHLMCNNQRWKLEEKEVLVLLMMVLVWLVMLDLEWFVAEEDL